VILYRPTAEDQTVYRRTGIVDRIAGRSLRGSLSVAVRPAAEDPTLKVERS